MNFIASRLYNGAHELSQKFTTFRKKNKRILKFVHEGAIVQMKLLDTINRFVGADLGHAVARSSWEKSECEQKCHFPINGRLHRSSKDAPSDAESLQIPISCHAIKFDSPLSRRTCVAVVASLDTWNEMATQLELLLGFEQKKNKRICKFVEMATRRESLLDVNKRRIRRFKSLFTKVLLFRKSGWILIMVLFELILDMPLCSPHGESPDVNKMSFPNQQRTLPLIQRCTL